MIEFKRVSVVYSNGVRALTDVSFRLEKDEFAFLVGPTGHGKSTVLKLIYREEVPSSGEVIVAGRDISSLPPSRIPHLRRKIGIVFQDFRLLPNRTVWENVAFALYVTGASKRLVHRRVPEAVARVGLLPKVTCFPAELSAGEQQRTCIARAIVNQPPILLADEPTGNLDPETSRGIVQLLAEINRGGTTVLVASHDREIVDWMQKRVITLCAGRVVSDREESLYQYEPSQPGVPAA